MHVAQINTVSFSASKAVGAGFKVIIKIIFIIETKLHITIIENLDGLVTSWLTI